MLTTKLEKAVTVKEPQRKTRYKGKLPNECRVNKKQKTTNGHRELEPSEGRTLSAMDGQC